MVHFQPNCEEGGDIRVAWSTLFISRSHLSCLHPNYFQKLKTKVYVHARHKIWIYFCRSGMEVFFVFCFVCLRFYSVCSFFSFLFFFCWPRFLGTHRSVPLISKLTSQITASFTLNHFIHVLVFIVKPTVTDYVRVNKYSLYLSTAYFFLINYFTLCKD